MTSLNFKSRIIHHLLNQKRKQIYIVISKRNLDSCPQFHSLGLIFRHDFKTGNEEVLSLGKLSNVDEVFR